MELKSGSIYKIKRTGNNTIRISNLVDFSLEKSLDSGQCFRYRQSNQIWQIISKDKMVLVRQDTPETIDMMLNSESDASYWINYLGLNDDYTQLKQLMYSTNNPFLIKCYETAKGLRILHQDPWETLVSFIISQRNNIPRIKTIVDKLSKLCGKSIVGVNGIAYNTFPTKSELLSGLKIHGESLGLGYRLPYLLELCESDFDMNFEHLDYNKAISKLTSLYGVGPKVANCVALFSLGYTEAFPIDVWISRIIEREFNGNFDHTYFGQFAGIVQQYMFYTYRLK